MALSNYSDIQSAVASWLDRDDLTNQIKDFISLAEIRLNRKLFIAGQETSDTISLVDGTAAYSLPANFREYIRIFYTKSGDNYQREIAIIHPDDAVRNFPLTDDKRSPDAAFIAGDQITFLPTPDDAYTVTIDYYGKVDALSDSTTTNWFTDNCPDLLLYGALMEAAPFLMEDARIATWQNLYQEGFRTLEAEDKRKRVQQKRPRARNDLRSMNGNRYGYDVRIG